MAGSARIRARRDASAIERTLAALAHSADTLRDASAPHASVLPVIIEAVRARATVGEISDTLARRVGRLIGRFDSLWLRSLLSYGRKCRPMSTGAPTGTRSRSSIANDQRSWIELAVPGVRPRRGPNRLGGRWSSVQGVRVLHHRLRQGRQEGRARGSEAHGQERHLVRGTRVRRVWQQRGDRCVSHSWVVGPG